ncbi:sensor histidine kinase [Jiulongibacter sediminis]|uniref:histidine kinase n=1 Tax=Jiulongibacter sediminis TaxID=1605367 RepID=A0A0N8HA01_9BACT|nr:HAMP domain-containing sensor histidine kinase [Jiulongibacter sediminis]KPM48796.1 hypothetical protein AFM12_09475 [Jiulongibacter sediminis]TBX25328.1 hypothetical protein TK44_09480 [Jiulongibacter sediminis]
MKKNKSTSWFLGQWPALLSLLLLGTFLGYYLYASFQTEKKRVEREMSYIFSDAVRQVEDGLIKHLVFLSDGKDKSSLQTVNLRGPVGSAPGRVKIREEIIGDSLPRHIEMEVNDFKYVDIRRDTISKDEHQLFVKKKVGDEVEEINFTTSAKEITGMLSWWEGMSSDSSGRITNSGDSTFSLEKYRPLIVSKMKEELSKDSLKLTFQLLTDSLSSNSNHIIASYRDIGSGERMELEMAGNFWQICKNILPQILTTLALFCFVGLSYFLMNRQYRKSRELLVFQNDFISNMTHELKTPMATMNVALEALQNFGIEKEEQRSEYLQIARTEAQKLGGLVDKALSVSKMSGQNINEETEQIELKSWLTEILNPIKLLAKESNSVILLEAESEVKIKTQPEVLKSILVNLIDNALKYCDAANPEVKIDFDKSSKEVEITVSDNGSPIPVNQRELIFQKFYRIPSAGETYRVKGHGLGLYLVKELSKQLGGKVRLKVTDSSNNFIVSLPYA